MANGKIHGTPKQREERSKSQQEQNGGRPHPAKLRPSGKDWVQRQGKPLPAGSPRPGNDGE